MVAEGVRGLVGVVALVERRPVFAGAVGAPVGDDEPSNRSEHPTDLRERGVACELVEGHRREGGVDAPIAERQVVDAGGHEFDVRRDALGLVELVHRRLDVDCVHRVGVRRGVVGVKAGAAAEVGDSVLGPERERPQQLLGGEEPVAPLGVL